MANYQKLDLARFTDTVLDVDETLLNRVLQNSRGKPTLSDEDVKLAVISLMFICKTQQLYLDELIDCVNELREEKSKKRRFFV